MGGANWRDGQRTLAKAPGALPRLIHMGIPYINEALERPMEPWQGSSAHLSS